MRWLNAFPGITLQCIGWSRYYKDQTVPQAWRAGAGGDQPGSPCGRRHGGPRLLLHGGCHAALVLSRQYIVADWVHSVPAQPRHPVKRPEKPWRTPAPAIAARRAAGGGSGQVERFPSRVGVRGARSLYSLHWTGVGPSDSIQEVEQRVVHHVIVQPGQHPLPIPRGAAGKLSQPGAQSRTPALGLPRIGLRAGRLYARRRALRKKFLDLRRGRLRRVTRKSGWRAQCSMVSPCW